MQNPAPKDLVARCLAHDEAAWAELVERYANLVYSTILKVQLPGQDVEEAFQASMVAIHRQLPKLREPERLVSWIVGIAHRQAINRIRAKTRDLSVADDHLEDHPADEELADASLARLAEIQQVQEGMNRLSERCSRLLRTLFYEDPPPDYETLSKREKIPIGSIGPTRARCLNKLRAILLESGWSG